MVASAITLGAIVGALLGGYLTDKIGRYRVFMADMVFFVVAAIACALAPNEYVLAGARFVMGLGVGIDLPVAMAFLSEFARLKGPGNKASSVAMWCPTVCGHQHLLSSGALLLRRAAGRPQRLALASDPWLRRGARAGDYRHPQPLYERIPGLGGESGQSEGGGVHPATVVQH